jgi:serine/threonine protein kinase
LGITTYATADEKQYRIREIFHSQDAMRLLGVHPNLIRIGDMFAWNDDSFVEPIGYVEGGQLLEWLLDKHSEQAMTWDEKARIIKGVAPGLAHAHKHGVIHRDVRPRNIVIAPGWFVKLANFDLSFIPGAANLNLARSVREHFDRRYVAPAVWENPSDVVPASDVYSLGLVYYQFITGQPPRHDAEAVLAGKGLAIDTEVLAAELRRTDSPNFMGDPASAAEVIGRMCAPQRSDRYATLAEALDDLAICEA